MYATSSQAGGTKTEIGPADSQTKSLEFLGFFLEILKKNVGFSKTFLTGEF